MPWTYAEFLANTKNMSFTEEDIAIIDKFNEFNMAVIAKVTDYHNHINGSEMSENIKNISGNALDQIRQKNLNSMLSTSPQSFTNDMKIINLRQGSNDEDLEKTYERAFDNAVEFMRFLEGKNILENYIDSALYNKDKKEVDKKLTADTIFNFVELLNKYNDAGLDVGYYKERYRLHQEKKQDMDKLMTLNKEEEAVDLFRNKTSTKYQNGKLYFRGSEQYKDIGTAYEDAVNEIQLHKHDILATDVYSVVGTRAMAAKQLVGCIKKLKALKDATEAYFDYKRNDHREGQWNEDPDQIANKNARARVKAALDMKKYAEDMTKLCIKKINVLVGKNTDDMDLDTLGVSQYIKDEEELQELNISEDIIKDAEIRDISGQSVSKNEDPAFTKAVTNDRKAITNNISTLVNAAFSTDKMKELTKGIAGVIAASALYEKKLSSKDFREEKNYQQGQIADNLNKLLLNKTISMKDLKTLAKKAFSVNGKEASLQYAELVRSAEKEAPAPGELIIPKIKNGPSMG